MAFWFVFNDKILTFTAGELSGARLFCIEMVEARFTRKYLTIFGNFKSLAIRFICFHSFAHITFSLLWWLNPSDPFYMHPIFYNLRLLNVKLCLNALLGIFHPYISRVRLGKAQL